MRRSRSARRCAVMSRAVPAMRSGLPAASRSTTLPRERTQTQSPLALRMRCSDSKISVCAGDVLLQAASAPAAGRPDGCESLRQSSVLMVSQAALAEQPRARRAGTGSCRGMFQSQNSSPEPHSARFRRSSRSRICADAGSRSRSRRRLTQDASTANASSDQRPAAAPAAVPVADARLRVRSTTTCIPSPLLRRVQCRQRARRHHKAAPPALVEWRIPQTAHARHDEHRDARLRRSRCRPDRAARSWAWSAAELHGALCGWLVGRRRDGRARRLAGEGDGRRPMPGTSAADSALDRLFAATEALLESPRFRLRAAAARRGRLARRARRRAARLVPRLPRRLRPGGRRRAAAVGRRRRGAARTSRRLAASEPQLRGSATRTTRKRWSRSRNSSASRPCCCTATACSAPRAPPKCAELKRPVELMNDSQPPRNTPHAAASS